jgi:hypothetical protein
MNTDRIKNIQKYGKTAQGQRELLNHLSGQRLTLKQAVLAYCYGCDGYYADGKVDCNMPHCSLHPFMAYNQNRIKRSNKKTVPVDNVEMSAVRL